MIIRKLKKTDFEEYIKLMCEFSNEQIIITTKIFCEIYDEIFKNNIIFVLEKDKKIIGTVKLLIDQKFFHNLSKYGFIEDVIINSEYRDNNYGEKLIKYVVDYCKKENFFKITLTCNKNLIKFYEKNHFEQYQIHMSNLFKNN